MRARLPTVLGLLAALLVPATAAAAPERKVPPRFFGTMWDKEIQDAPLAVQDRQWARMATSGVEAARVIFSWNLAQEQQGQTTYAYTDPMVEHGARHGIELLPVVTYAPPWARVEPAALGSAPSNHVAYVDYLRLLIARYGPGGRFWEEHPNLPYRPLRTWQIWNEPGVRYQWSPPTDWPQRYGELLRAAYPAVKQADPGATVVLAGLANASWADLDALYDEGNVEGSFDIAAVHYYARMTADFLEIGRRFRAALDAHGDRAVPVWWTEAGASASHGRIAAPGNHHFQTTDRGLAHGLTKTYRMFIAHRRRLGIARVYWYTWASSYDRRGGAFDFSGMNVFDGARVEPKPSLAAYTKAARRYEGCTKDTRGRCVRR